MEPITKPFKKEFTDKRDIAYRYFSILSVFNNLKLTEREIDLLTHISTIGTISSVTSKKEFTKLYNTTIPTLNNIISKLYKRKLLLKSEGKIRINPVIAIDFSKSDTFIFSVKCLYKEKELTTK